MRSEALCPGLVDDDLSTGSLYHLLHTRCSLVVVRGERSLEVVAAGPWARVRDAAQGSPLLQYLLPALQQAALPRGRHPVPLRDEADDVGADGGHRPKLTRVSGGKRVRSGWEFVYNVPIWAVLQIEPMVRQLGGELVNPSTGKPQFDSAPVIRTMRFFQDLRFKYKTTDPAFPSADLGVDMARGRVAMWIAGIWAIAGIVKANPKMKGEVGVAPLPTWTPGGKRVTCKYAWAWYVNPRSAPQKQREGWKFISFLTA